MRGATLWASADATSTPAAATGRSVYPPPNEPDAGLTGTASEPAQIVGGRRLRDQQAEPFHYLRPW